MKALLAALVVPMVAFATDPVPQKAFIVSAKIRVETKHMVAGALALYRTDTTLVDRDEMVWLRTVHFTDPPLPHGNIDFQVIKLKLRRIPKDYPESNVTPNWFSSYLREEIDVTNTIGGLTGIWLGTTNTYADRSIDRGTGGGYIGYLEQKIGDDYTYTTATVTYECNNTYTNQVWYPFSILYPTGFGKFIQSQNVITAPAQAIEYYTPSVAGAPRLYGRKKIKHVLDLGPRDFWYWRFDP